MTAASILPGFDFSLWDIGYFVLVYLFFGIIIGFLYFLYYHVIRSFQWSGEAKIEWTFKIYFGSAFEFGSKPIFQLLAPFRNTGKDIVGLIIGGQRYFFLLDPTNAEIVLKESTKPRMTNPIKDNTLMNFFNISPSFWHKGFPSNEKLQNIHNQHLLPSASLSKYLPTVIHTMQHLYVQELVLPVAGSTSDLFAVSLYEFVCRSIFHINLTTLFQPSKPQATRFPTTPEKAQELYAIYQTYAKALPLTMGGIHLQYFKTSEKAYKELLTTFSTFTQGMNDIQQSRLQYFYDICQQSPDFRSEIHKYQLSFLHSSVANSSPLAFWVIFCILYHQHHHSDVDLIGTIRKEIQSNIPNYCSLLESELVKSLSPEVAVDSSSSDLTLDQFSNLITLDACITEALRLTSGSLIMKKFEEKGSLKLSSGKTYSFRKNDRIGVSPSVFHYDETYFDDPHDFHPERWLKGETLDEKISAAQGKLTITTKEGKQVER